MVIIRGNESGLFQGKLVSFSRETGAICTGLLKIWSWGKGAGEIAGPLEGSDMAARGVKSAKVSPRVPGTSQVSDAREIWECTPESVASFDGLKVWGR